MENGLKAIDKTEFAVIINGREEARVGVSTGHAIHRLLKTRLQQRETLIAVAARNLLHALGDGFRQMSIEQGDTEAAEAYDQVVAALEAQGMVNDE